MKQKEEEDYFSWLDEAYPTWETALFNDETLSLKEKIERAVCGLWGITEYELYQFGYSGECAVVFETPKKPGEIKSDAVLFYNISAEAAEAIVELIKEDKFKIHPSLDHITGTSKLTPLDSSKPYKRLVWNRVLLTGIKYYGKEVQREHKERIKKHKKRIKVLYDYPLEWIE